IFSDVALFQLMMNQTQVIFETDSKELIEHLLEVFKSNKVYKKTTFTINTKYINHSIIEDGYYTFSQIYQHHNVLKYTIVNT
ncbi:hypothetical protein, partial [Klebsiella quasipneumoniae]|uniref:hypothetical protein n=1 Tax=Klebsiella quasipneumoniae TaxID=1463165 RepID=UPI00273031DF